MDWRRARRGSCSVPIVVVLILRIDVVEGAGGVERVLLFGAEIELCGPYLRSMVMDPQTSIAGSWDDSGLELGNYLAK